MSKQRLETRRPRASECTWVGLGAALAGGAGKRLCVANATFWLAGGVRAAGLRDVTLQLDGARRTPARAPRRWRDFVNGFAGV